MLGFAFKGEIIGCSLEQLLMLDDKFHSAEFCDIYLGFLCQIHICQLTCDRKRFHFQRALLNIVEIEIGKIELLVGSQICDFLKINV